MKLLPNNEKRKVTQKVVVGDKNGVLQCFGIKKRELNVRLIHCSDFFNSFVLMFIC